jgi:hypothetical protein
VSREPTAFPHVSRIVLGAACTLLISSGCSLLGPRALTNGRIAYTDAIAMTNEQQLLSAIVRARYGRSAEILTVSGITSSLSFQTDASVQLGFGNTNNYEGNLVPLSTGVSFKESPTIQYVPMQGEKHSRKLLSPLPVDLLVLLCASSDATSELLTWLVRTINGVHNPAFLLPGGVVPDTRFAEIVQLLSRLQRSGNLDWAQAGPKKHTLALVVHSYVPEQEDAVERLLSLLGAPKSRRRGADVVMPVVLAVGSPRPGRLELRTRSLYDLFRVAAASVEVSDADAHSGVAMTFPELAPAGHLLRVHSSAERPAEAPVAVRHRGAWFYLDPTDQRSKRGFRVLQAVLNYQLAEPAASPVAPVLTVPVR